MSRFPEIWAGRRHSVMWLTNFLEIVKSDIRQLSRVGEVGRGGLNRPKLSVPRFHFAPHRTGHTDFPCPALRVCLVASLQALLRGCVQPALTGSGHSP